MIIEVDDDRSVVPTLVPEEASLNAVRVEACGTSLAVS
jgi:hypothetical protein